MITGKQLKDLMTAKPFRPFRICMSSGESYEVANHDCAMVMANCLEAGLEPNAEGFAQRVVRCSCLHINSIEELQAA